MPGPPAPADRRAWFRRLGPGLITGAADDAPSGIATYSQSGAQFGVDMLSTVVLTFPLMAAIQAICGRIGRVIGQGLATNMARVLPRPLAYAIVLLLFSANTVNIGAHIVAMGTAMRLVLGWGEVAGIPGVAQSPDYAFTSGSGRATCRIARTHDRCLSDA